MLTTNDAQVVSKDEQLKNKTLNYVNMEFIVKWVYLQIY